MTDNNEVLELAEMPFMTYSEMTAFRKAAISLEAKNRAYLISSKEMVKKLQFQLDTILPLTEKYQRQIAMLRDRLTSIKSVVCGERHPRWSNYSAVDNSRGHIADICEIDSATQQSSEAFIAEVRAEERQSILEELQEFFSDAIQADFENGVKLLNEREAEEFKRRFPNIWECIGKIGTMLDAAELRNSAAQGKEGGK